MHPALPIPPDRTPRPGADDDFDFFAPQAIDVGAFEQGSPASRWALARYLVGRAIAESLARGLLVLGLVLIALAGLSQWGGATLLTVLLVIVALGVLVLRAVLTGLLVRLTAIRADPAVRDQLKALVRRTRRDVLRELRRIGLPGRTITLPLLALRLLRRRHRAETVSRLRNFQVDNAVGATRLDELHLLLHSPVRY